MRARGAYGTLERECVNAGGAASFVGVGFAGLLMRAGCLEEAVVLELEGFDLLLQLFQRAFDDGHLGREVV